MTNLTKEQILLMIKDKKISAEEGLKLYKKAEQSLDSQHSEHVVPVKNKIASDVEKSNKLDIAVVGMSGIFPQAKNVAEFWSNLKNGVNSVCEITRWNPDDYYDETLGTANKSYCKWGGFLEGIDKFDPLFFELSPKQAELMEPRQRLFLQEAWKTIEDAGYTASEMKEKKVGVFLGCEGSTEYFNDLKEDAVSPHVFLGHSNAILASRISYFMNLQGPTLTIDTACSSSLVAIHTACESILSGNCEMALAGGVNIMTAPQMYIMLCSMGMLSPEGKCKAFDNNADGFVPGEVIGAVLLKPLAAAIRDKNYIYGVIKGSGINQDGKTNGITAPSALSQTRLEKQVYMKFGINPEDISYIETHGTGTKLGDPIEFEALRKSFSNYTNKKNFCALGSVKTNIGHASAASGIASFIKVLLSMKYGELPPMLHFKEANKQIELADSPFYINTTLKEWKKNDGKARVAAISSFGHGGTNCHIVLEEGFGCDKEAEIIQKPYYFIPFSAKTKDSLKNYIKVFYTWLITEGKEYDFGNIAYNMLANKNHFHERIALVAADRDDLIKQLFDLIDGDFAECFIKKQKLDNLVEEKKKVISWFEVNKQEDIVAYKEHLLIIKNLYEYSEFEDASVLYGTEAGYRIPLPTYQFKEERYWLAEEDRKEHKEGFAKLAELIDSNESSLKEQCYKKVFDGSEFFIKDHMNMLPAVVYLEMVRTAAELANKPYKVKRIRNSVWQNPILFEDKQKEVFVKLKVNAESINYSIQTLDEQRELVEHSQGEIEYSQDSFEQNRSEKYDIEAILSRCQGGTDEASEFYHRLESMGAVLGRRFRGLKEFYCNEEEAISVLGIPNELEEHKKQYVIHPTLTDGGLQTVVTWAYHTTADLSTIYLPFVLGSLELINTNLNVRYAYVKKSPKQNSSQAQTIQYDISYLDESGEVVYQMKDFCIRALQKIEGKEIKPDTITMNYWNNIWKETNRVQDVVDIEKPIIFFCKQSADAEVFIKKGMQVITVVPGDTYKKLNDIEYILNPTDEQGYEYLFEEIKKIQKMNFFILHMWSDGQFAGQEEVIEKQLEQSIYSCYHLIKTLQKQGDCDGVKVIFAYESASMNSQPIYQAMSGFFKSVRQEYKNLVCKIARVDSEFPRKKEILLDEFAPCFDSDIEVCFEKDGRRYIRQLVDTGDVKKSCDVPIRKNGVYLITGGTGGLGFVFAEYLYHTYKANLILIGRSELNKEKTEKLGQLQKEGCKIEYIRGDITSSNSMKKIISEAKQKFGLIHGVIHSAGVVKDALLFKKKFSDFQDVLAPKVYGTINLFESLKEETLDFFVMFSSTTAVLGNVGQADYAYANSFMDQFAWMKTEQENSCNVYSINWPMWKEGGMHVDVQMQTYIEKTFGMKAIPNEMGVKAFEDVLCGNVCQQVVFAGDMEKIQSIIKREKNVPHTFDSKVEMDSSVVMKMFQKDFLTVMSELIKLDIEDIDIEQNMEAYGFDSITFTQLANKLNDRLRLEITPAIFFGQSSPKSIIYMLLEEYRSGIEAYYAGKLTEEKKVNEPLTLEIRNAKTTENRQVETYRFPENPGTVSDKDNEEVAIIGMHGIMPQSDDLDEFWDNILANKNMITEVPRDRWNWEEYYGDPQKENKTNVKWGGFMNEIDKFDPMFFHISGRDAEAMDPQERLVIESTWKTIEDAGYKVSDLHESNTGVFIGVTNADYNELMIKKEKLTAMTHTMVTNRVSYLLNFTGPSETIDTACSSSLVAIHRAVEEIRNHTCECAIAGGVNVIACPNLYIFQSKAGMLSPDGVCRTFDKDANGYVRGEGVGTVLLKPLAKAKADGDHIYGVIIGTSMNHNGHGNDLLAPNSNAQAKAVVDAVEQSGVDPETISYIETHGTGTKLGDPVEIEGLKKAFRQLYKKWGKTYNTTKRIGIGTVKTNIGHLESAAGIAGIFKVLLSMKNKKLPALLHYQELNPYIQLADTPFYIVKDSCDWESCLDDENKKIPLRAGISSFGIGGVNVHVVLQEYIDESDKQEPRNQEELILLSAKDKERLSVYAHNLHDYLLSKKSSFKITEKNKVEDGVSWADIETKVKQVVANVLSVNEQEISMQDNILEYGFKPMQITSLCENLNLIYNTQLNVEDITSDSSIVGLANTISVIKAKEGPLQTTEIEDYAYEQMSLENIAYTLQFGREELEERLVFLASSIEEVCDKLEVYYDKKECSNSLVYAGTKKEKCSSSMEESSREEQIRQLLEERSLYKLGEWWSCGEKIDWSILYKDSKPHRISLPSYPFAKERYWIEEAVDNVKKKVVVNEQDDDAMLTLLKKIANGEVKAEEAKFI